MTITSAERLTFIAGHDGLELTGALFGEPAGGNLVVLTHGSGDRFCDRNYVEIGRGLASRGHALLSTDTRGHDIVSFQEVDGELVGIGAAFERYTDSVADIQAWMTAARRLSPSRLVLGGHSLGGPKAVRALAGVAASGLLLLSPAVTWEPNTDRIRLADELTSAGRGAQLMPPHPDTPPWNLVSAGTLHDFGALIERVFADSSAPWGAIDAPTLVLFGGAEKDNDSNIALLRGGWSSHHPLTCQIIDNADHFFRGYAEQVADVVADWLTGLD